MNNAKYDKETAAQLSRADAINAMLESSGWAFAEEDLNGYISELKDATTLNPDDPNMVQTLRDRINTAAVLEDWLENLKSQVNNAIIMRSDSDTSNLIERR